MPDTTPAETAAISEEPTYVDLSTWYRQGSYHHFRDYENPFYNMTLRVDIAPLRAQLQGTEVGIGLAMYYLLLRLAHEHEPLRMRLHQGRVRVLPSVDGGTTVLRHDDSFTTARLPYDPDFAVFTSQAKAAIAQARLPGSPFAMETDDAILHFTTVPWVHFTSFSHAYRGGGTDSVPKFALGRADHDGSRLWLPLSIDVHHALVDGVHVGRFIRGCETALREPQKWIFGS